MAGLALLGCSQDAGTKERPKTEISQPGTAPKFELRSITGEKVSSQDFIGKVPVFLVFGATWCPHCVHEIPELKEIYRTYKDKPVKLLYINVRESPVKVKEFAKKNEIRYTVLVDSAGEVARSYKVYGIPHQVIIGIDGRILYEGPRPSDGLLKLLQRTLKDL